MDVVNLDLAADLGALPPEELVRELSALAIAVNFNYERFCRAALIDPAESHMLWSIVLDDLAQLWRESGRADLDEAARIFRWKVITA